MAKKKNDELEFELTRLLSDTESYSNSEVSAQREKAWDYYHGEPYGNEVSGRSNVVTREIYDAVEWIKPELMRIFCSGDTVVEYVPVSDDDVAAAEQETSYINHVVMHQNPGFKNFLDWFTDGLLQKNGVAKYWWDESFNTTEEEYENITAEEAAFLAQNHPDMELVKFEEEVDEADGVTVTHTCAYFKVRTSKPQARWEIIPPEEFLISRDARDINSATLVAHRRKVTRSDCLEMGFTEKQLADVRFTEGHDDGLFPEKSARHRHDSTEDYTSPTSGDPSQDVAWLYECYFKSDVNGDGKAELIKAYAIDGTILEWEHAQVKPFASIAPLSLPHKYYGLSFYDILRDIQLMKSSLTRAMMDNAALMNHNRWGIVDGMVNIDDLVNSRPNGVIRMKSANALVPIQSQSLDGNTFNLLDYLDNMSESRSGVSRSSQGLDPNTLRSNVAASSVNAVMTAAMQKRDLIARIIAETGVKELFLGLHGLIRRHAKEADYVRLNGKFVAVDPTSWRDRQDVVVRVGLGNSNREYQLATYQSMTQIMQIAGNAFPQMISPENAYAWLKEGFKIHGYKAPERFVTDPATVEPPQEQPDPKLLVAQMKQQLESAKLQETQRSNMKKEELAEAEIVRKTMKDEEEIAVDREELKLERSQARPVSIGNK